MSAGGRSWPSSSISRRATGRGYKGAARDPGQDAGEVGAPGDRRVADAGARRRVDAQQGGPGHPVRGGEEGAVAAHRDDEAGGGERAAALGVEGRERVDRERERCDAQAGEGREQGGDGALLLAGRVRHLAGEPPAGAGEPLRHALAGGDRRLDHQDAGGEERCGPSRHGGGVSTQRGKASGRPPSTGSTAPVVGVRLAAKKTTASPTWAAESGTLRRLRRR